MTGQILTARDSADVAACVKDARASGRALEIRAAGSRLGLGRPDTAGATLDVSAMAGIVDYDPAELVLTARPGTPLAEIEALVAGEGQYLAFEPPHCRFAGEGGTLGGAVACGWGGPRRVLAGRLRDHILGISGVTGWGTAIRAGGKVIKNVTGYDVPKLVAGSMGTLMVLTELTIKVLPAPRHSATLRVHGLTLAAAVRVMAAAMASPCAVSGAAHVPRGHHGQTLLRIEGTRVSVADRLDRLRASLVVDGREMDVLDGAASAAVWQAVRDVDGLAGCRDAVIWRVALPPSLADRFIAMLAALDVQDWLFDCAGGLIWLALPAAPDGHEGAVRAALRNVAGQDGLAVLAHAPASVRSAVAVFHPPEPEVAALEERLRHVFDPDRVLNPGRIRAVA